MATSFLEIYSRSMSQIKDPMLARLQDTDLYTFCIIMNNYLLDGRTRYNPNQATWQRISNVLPESFGEQSFVGDGVTTSFILSDLVLPTAGDTILQVDINGDLVTNYTYNETSNSLVFTVAPQVGSTILVQWVLTGAFLNELNGDDVTFLALATCLGWATQVQNNREDIDRSLNDSGDFKQHSNATTTNAKVDWLKHFEEIFQRLVNKSDWRCKLRNETNCMQGVFIDSRAQDIDNVIALLSQPNTKLYLVKG